MNSEDVAISTLRDIKIGKWNLDQVQEWLTAVLGNSKNSVVLSIINVLSPQDKVEVKNPSKKRKYPENVPSFFGSTTISNRKRRYAQETKHSEAKSNTNQSDSLSFGQRLIVMKFESLVGDEHGNLAVEDAKLLRDSLNSRLAYEAAIDEINRLENLQEWRLRTEKSSTRVPGYCSY